MTPFVGNYNGLIKALEKNNLKNGEDFYVWNYDWRKPVGELVKDLNIFINGNVGDDEKVVLIGHSMGGLISRIWAEENYNSEKLKNVITLGSPHLGSVDSYFAWNSGQVYDKSKFTSIALNTLVQLQSLKTKTKAEAVHKYTPSVKDLLPTFNFAVKDGLLLNNNQLKYKNDYLVGKNNSAVNLNEKLRLYAGGGHQTLSGISLKGNNYFDKILDIWPDGRVESVSTDDGDGTVLVKSANYSKNNAIGLESNHGDIVDKTVNSVMKELDLNEVGVISETRNFDDNLVVFIGSPVNFQVKCDNDNPVDENEGFVVIKNKNYKSCVVSLNGTGSGKIHVVMGNTDNNDWSYWEKDIETEENISIIVNPKTGQMINNKENINFLKSLIKEDLVKLIISCGKNKNLAEALKFFNKNQPRLLIKNIFDFRKTNQTNDILGREIINNAKIWMSITDKCSISGCADRLVNVGYAREKIKVSKLNDIDWWSLQDSDL